jgi:UTP:GlnB (protein PII) uridylyltransferase
MGLLQDLLFAFTRCGLNIVQALVQTEEQMALDTFFVTDLHARPILDAPRLETVRKALIEAVAI